MPIITDIGFSSPMTGGADFSATVTMDNNVSSDTTIQLYCNNTTLITGSGGSAFPTSLVIPSGSNHASVTLHAGTVTSNTTVTLAAGQPGTDMSNSANWQASRTLTVQTNQGPGN